MRDWRYTLSIGLITAMVLVIGGVVWNSGTTEISGGTIEFTNSPWCRGTEEVPITIDMYIDFG